MSGPTCSTRRETGNAGSQAGRRPYHCSTCGEVGHNCRGCPHLTGNKAMTETSVSDKSTLVDAPPVASSAIAPEPSVRCKPTLVDAASTASPSVIAPRLPKASLVAPSRIRLTDTQRDELLRLSITTGVVFDCASRVAKAIRTAVTAAALEQNYDPLIALKPILAALPSRRRAETRKHLLDLFFADDVHGLLGEARKSAMKPPTSNYHLRPRPKSSNIPDKAAMAALAAGRPGRALRRLGRATLLAPSEETADKLRKLHPVGVDPPLGEPGNSAPALPGQIVSIVLRSMRLSAPGPSGLRADHLLLAYPSGQNDYLQTLLNSIVNGDAPRWLADAQLIALPKKDGGVRPIAIGETLRRVAAAALIRSVLDVLPPLARQYVLRRDGCLSVATIIRAAIETNSETCVLSVDIRNAFNSVCRSAVIEAARHTPLGLYTQWAYGFRSRLCFGTHTVDSCTGVQQGDPAGPALFAMALAQILAKARVAFTAKTLDLWYADDGALIGPAADVIHAYEALRSPLENINLMVNAAKCQLWLPRAETLTNSCPVHVVDGASSVDALVVLGFPVAGSEAALRAFAQAAVTKATQTSAVITSLHHAQGEAALLRACGPTSRLRHLFRFSPNSSMHAAICAADDSTLDHAARIIGRPPPHGWQDIASQSVNAGGLGFELLRNLNCRYLSRWGLYSTIQSVLSAIEHDRHQGLDVTLIQQLLSAAQVRKLPDESVRTSTAADDNLSASDKLRIASTTAPHASDYLMALPGPDTILSDAEFHDAVWIRLGLPAAAGHSDCTPTGSNDPLGLHRLGCKAAADARLRRHNELVATVAKAARSADPAAFQVEREARAPVDAHSRVRPGDIVLNLGDGRTYADVTVVNPFSAAHTTASRFAGSPAAAAENAYDRKVTKYAPYFDSADALTSKFIPLGVTAMGVWDERSLRWLRKFSDVCAAATAADPGSVFASLMTRLSVALWRGNSQMLRACRSTAA